MQGGVYQLLVHLPEATCIQIGKKGRFRFPKGHYLYTGSAKNGLQGRVGRHLRKEKKRFWHIDYLLDRASVKGVFLFTDSKVDECSLSKSTLKRPGASVMVQGFGSSDCSCPAHLAFFGRFKGVGIRRQS
jgi:Uri superfamily endonuclease